MGPAYAPARAREKVGAGDVKAQLPLGIALRATSSFENFLPGPNAEAAMHVRRIADGAAENLFLFGPPATGKTHLVEAACRAAQAHSEAPVYLPLTLVELTPAVLDGLEGRGLIAVDGLQHIAVDAAWERALFALIERARDRARFIFTARTAPIGLAIAMPDLKTRLAQSLAYALAPLTDEDKAKVLMQRAQELGMELSAEAARYVMSRRERDLGALMTWLERVERASLVHQRRLTIPFLRSLDD